MLPENPYLSDEQIDKLMDLGDASRVLAIQRERDDDEFKVVMMMDVIGLGGGV